MARSIHEYVVYMRPSGRRCRVGALMIPHGKTFDDVRGYLPHNMGAYVVIPATGFRSARGMAGMWYGITCHRPRLGWR